VPAGDFYQNIYFSIVRSGSTSFHIEIGRTTGIVTGDSNDNSMTLNRIDIGEELYGTSGGFSPESYWNDNRWVDSNYNYRYQNRDGDRDTSANPPYAGWLAVPSASSTGGTWKARTF